jgi:hypothetical protein
MEYLHLPNHHYYIYYKNSYQVHLPHYILSNKHIQLLQELALVPVLLQVLALVPVLLQVLALEPE